MASGTLTITGATGPASAVTALVLSNVSDIDFDLASSAIRVKSAGVFHEFDYAVEATVTYTISGSTAAITIST